MFSYNPYGDYASSWTYWDTQVPKVRFTGKERESNGLDYFGARYYDSSPTHRWISADRLSARIYDPLSLNKYSYVRCDPVNLVDPDGRFERPWWMIVGMYDEAHEFGEGEIDSDLTSDNPIEDVVGGGTDETEQQPCPPGALLPSRGIPSGEVERNIKEAHDLFDSQLIANPEGAMQALMRFFVGKFMPGGKWDYKSRYDPVTEPQDRAIARDFGNFNFGAVLRSFGFTYTFAQSAAGAAQILISVTGGASGQGIPGLRYPFGDQVSDAVVIKRGFDYQAAIQGGCR